MPTSGHSNNPPLTVAELWRYPVKSMGGERLHAVAAGPRGLHADRLWAVRDLDADQTASGRRIAALLTCRARYLSEPALTAGPGAAPEVVVEFPGGDEISSSDPAMNRQLSDLAGRNVRLVPLPRTSDRRDHRAARTRPAQMRADLGLAPDDPLPDISELPLGMIAGAARNTTPVGTFVDVAPLHLITQASLATIASALPHPDLDVRRFRPNVVIAGGAAEGFPERGWRGGALEGREVAMAVTMSTLRCVVPTRPQPGLRHDADVMRTVARMADRWLGVYCDVTRSGCLEVHEELTITDLPSTTALDGAVGAAKRATFRTVRRVLR